MDKGHCNADILGGISDEQWLAFTIEEEFSRCRVSSLHPDTSLSSASSDILTPNQPQPSQRMLPAHSNRTQGHSDCLGKGDTLNVEKLLDEELLRIFIKYEAQETSSMVNKEHLDICTALIGKSLKNEKEKVDEPKLKQRLIENKFLKDKKGVRVQHQDDERNRNHSCGYATAGNAKLVQDGDTENVDGIGGNDENESDNTERMEVKSRESDNWPLLRFIMQLDNIPMHPQPFPSMDHSIEINGRT